MRTLLDVCLQRDRSSVQYREFVFTAHAALRNLSALLDHVLTLARLDARVELARLERVAIDSVIADAVAIVQPVAQARDVTIAVTGHTDTVLETD
ncbi:MAG TPA: hypothetical protein VNF72_00845, partial [Myxococcota bacterium]|nr:hypothetical protein [Myxococcota bacterium]